MIPIPVGDMVSMKANCPHCQKDFDLSQVPVRYNKKYGREGNCPHCGKKLFFPRFKRVAPNTGKEAK